MALYMRVVSDTRSVQGDHFERDRLHGQTRNEQELGNTEASGDDDDLSTHHDPHSRKDNLQPKQNPHTRQDSVSDHDSHSGKDTESAHKERQHMDGRFTTITWSLIISTCPMIFINAALLALVFKFRVDVTGVPHPQLTPSSLVGNLGNAYYIDLSSTFLIFVSSWASSIAPLCGGMLITLASYPICKAYLSRMGVDKEGKLPTPYQFSLVVRFLNGGSFGALWSWLLYCFGWRGRQRQSGPVKQVAVLTISVVLLR